MRDRRAEILRVGTARRRHADRQRVIRLAARAAQTGGRLRAHRAEPKLLRAVDGCSMRHDLARNRRFDDCMRRARKAASTPRSAARRGSESPRVECTRVRPRITCADQAYMDGASVGGDAGRRRTATPGQPGLLVRRRENLRIATRGAPERSQVRACDGDAATRRSRPVEKAFARRWRAPGRRPRSARHAQSSRSRLPRSQSLRHASMQTSHAIRQAFARRG